MAPDNTIRLCGKVNPTGDFFLVSERLGFRTWKTDDKALAAALWGDVEVTRLTGGPFGARQVQERLADEIWNLELYGVQYWPIFRLDTVGHVGCCGLRPRNVACGEFELGFQLRRDAWGRGYAFEAAQLVIAWAATRGITALIAGHHPHNHASRRTLQRLGFVYTHDEYYSPTEQMEPCYRLSIVASPPKDR